MKVTCCCCLLYAIVIMQRVITFNENGEINHSLTKMLLRWWCKSHDDNCVTCDEKTTNVVSVGCRSGNPGGCKPRIEVIRKFNCTLDAYRGKGSTGCVEWMSILSLCNSHHIEYNYVYSNSFCKVVIHNEQLSIECIGFHTDCNSECMSMMSISNRTLVTSSCGTELLHPFRKVGSIELVSLKVVHSFRRYVLVNHSEKGMELQPITRDFKTKSHCLDFIKTNLNCIILLLVLFWLISKSIQTQDSLKQDTEKSHFNNRSQLNILNKHLWQSYFSPDVQDTVCCTLTQNTLDTSVASNGNFNRDGIKSQDTSGRSDLYSDYPNDRTPGHETHTKTGKARRTVAKLNVKMADEWDRYKTYGKCPNDAQCKHIFETTLAKHGFYFNLEKNVSECFSCGLEMRKWEEDEPVKAAHLRLSPNCDFANGKDEEHNECTRTEEASCAIGGEENVTMKTSDETPVTEHKANKNGHQRSEQGQRRGTETPQEERSYVDDTLIGNARHPDLASRDDRMSTYLNWAFSHAVSINSLVDAGLYYTGTGDEVRCFHCGGGMRNWQQGDDPWMEHAHWFHDCEYVRQCRGQEFIDMVRMSRAFERGLDTSPSHRTLQPTEEERYTGTETQTFSRHRANPRAPASDTATVQMPDFSMVDSVSDMGFNKEHVILALGHLRRNHSEGYRVEPEELIECLLANPQADPSVITPERSTDGSEAARPKKHKQKKKKPKEITDGAASTENTDISLILDENQKLKQQLMCKVCMDSDACVVFLPCGHMVTCVKCSSALRKCAICRAKIDGNIRIYMG